MAEYAGYVRRQPPINWGTVAGDIVNKMGDIEKEQAAFREKYDTMAADISKEIGEYEAGKSPAFNDLVYSATAEGREMIAEMHNKLKRREISPDEFNRMKMSISNQWADFSTLTKNYNEAVAGTMEGLQNGELSGVSQWALDQFGELANLKNKRLQWMPNDNGYTNLYVTSTDDEGNMVGEPTSVTTLTNPGNLAYLRVDVPEEVSKYADKLATYKIGRTSSPKEREGYEDYLNKSIDAITATDNDVASILSEYDGTDFYKSSEEPIKGGIEMTTDENGNWKPVITDEQRKRAKEIVREQFEFQVPYTKTFREYKPPKDDGYTNEELNIFNQGYNATWNATNAVYKDGELKGFEQMDNKLYNFDIEADGTITVTNKDGEVMIEGLERGKKETAKALAPYYSEKFGGTGWQVIHNQEQRAEKIPGEVERDAYVASADDIKLIDEVTRMSYDNVAEAQQKIVDLMSSVNPLIEKDIEFLTPTSDMYLGYINFKIGDETFKIAIDEGKGLMDVFDEQTVTDNKNEITKAINKSLGVNTTPAP